MADNRTNKKQIKRYQKQLQKLEATLAGVVLSEEQEVHINGRIAAIKKELVKLQAPASYGNEWDDRDEDHEYQVVRDLSRKAQRRDPWEAVESDREYGLGYMQGRGAA